MQHSVPHVYWKQHEAHNRSLQRDSCCLKLDSNIQPSKIPLPWKKKKFFWKKERKGLLSLIGTKSHIYSPTDKANVTCTKIISTLFPFHLLPKQPEHLGTWVATVSQESPRWEISQGSRLENSQLARLRSTKCITLSDLMLTLRGCSIPALLMGKVVTEQVCNNDA